MLVLSVCLFVTEATQYCVHGGLQQIKGSYANPLYKNYWSWQDSNLQYSELNSDALSIRPHNLLVKGQKISLAKFAGARCEHSIVSPLLQTN